MLLNDRTDQPSLCATPNPIAEIAAYESIWTRLTTMTRVATLFRRWHHASPTQVARELGIADQEIDSIHYVIAALLPFARFGALFYGGDAYPLRLQDAKYPPEVLYYQGALELLNQPAVAVIGSRQASTAGLYRAKRLARLLVQQGLTVMSGLAQGIDTAAHTAALEAGGRTIAVIGTPLHVAYPRENLPLQRTIAQQHLLISPVPFYLYSRQDSRRNRCFFPERNKTMSALSAATVIVEATDRSGTLVQAEAAIQQGRSLFILNSCFGQGLEWPNQFLERGAIRVVEGHEIWQHCMALSARDD